MLRPRVALMLVLFAFLGMVNHGYQGQLNWRLGLVILVMASWYVHATTVNDISDEKIDKINLPQAKGRPLVTKQATINELWQLNMLAGLLSLALAFWLGPINALLVLVGLFLNYTYSLPPLRLSYRGYIAPLLLPLGYVTLPYLIGSQVEGSNPLQSFDLVWLGMYLGFTGRIILKDLRDVVGDRRYGKRTFIVMHGKAATCIVSAVFWLASNLVLLSIIPANWTFLLSFELLFIWIFVCLFQINKTRQFDYEQVHIGLLAKAANGLVILLSALLLVKNGNANLNQQISVVIFLSIFISMPIINGLYKPSQLVLGYKG